MIDLDEMAAARRRRRQEPAVSPVATAAVHAARAVAAETAERKVRARLAAELFALITAGQTAGMEPDAAKAWAFDHFAAGRTAEGPEVVADLAERKRLADASAARARFGVNIT